jgi:hypothetical protein
MSILPKRFIVASTHAWPCSISPAFAAKISVSPSISFAAARSASSLREVNITCAPASTNDFAIALPMPREAPVTNAVLPRSEISMNRD